ncbi:MAG: hypothetical protein FWD62_15665 [Betaproteobacteria bacterium]|nr:hypothetical protein [Betaproteobacteria bacterium]
MTRIVRENGKLVLKSFSYFGPGGDEEAEAEFQRVVARIEEQNRKVDAGEIPPFEDAPPSQPSSS